MKTKPFLLAFLLIGLIGAAIRPSSAACVELLSGYLKSPHATLSPSAYWYGSEFALVRIVTVHTDNKPRDGWGETGTLWLIKIESNGKTLPTIFSIPYEKRGGKLVDGVLRMPTDCATWDSIAPKPGERLMGFFRPDSNGWVIPELPSFDVVLDVDSINPVLRQEIQPLFRTRL